VVREPVEVLKEQLHLLVRQPLAVPLVAHAVTIRAERGDLAGERARYRLIGIS
jgi:hypothetical protein